MVIDPRVGERRVDLDEGDGPVGVLALAALSMLAAAGATAFLLQIAR